MKVREGFILGAQVIGGALVTAGSALAVGSVLQQGGEKAAGMGLKSFGEGTQFLGKSLSDGGKAILGAGYAAVVKLPKWVYDEGFAKGVQYGKDYFKSGQAASDAGWVSEKFQEYTEKAIVIGETDVVNPIKAAFIEMHVDEKIKTAYEKAKPVVEDFAQKTKQKSAETAENISNAAKKLFAKDGSTTTFNV